MTPLLEGVLSKVTRGQSDFGLSVSEDDASQTRTA